jgi:antibiotic biosynthesis monooxygenase (ABM) superfamily enzyme
MFGIQLKGFLIGLLVAYFVIPWVQRMLLSRSAAPAN